MIEKNMKKWTRDGGRLKRIQIQSDPAVWLKDDDIFILKSNATNAIGLLVVQQIPKKPQIRQVSQISELLSLPLELFLSICVFLDVKDVENLGRVCKDLDNLVKRTFLPRVILPLSEQSLRQLGGPGGRFILSLSSSVNIRLWGEGGFETMLRENMNLKYLKEVKFVGNNYSVEYRGGLISGYKNIMKNILFNKKYLRKIDISIDSSEECYRQLQRLKDLPYLEELSLRSSGLGGQFNRTMPEGRKLNQMLKDTLANLNIQSLELKGFNTPWEEYTECFGMEIFSDTIQVLKLDYYSKTFELAAIKAVNLKEIQISSDFWYRNQDPRSLARILSEGCPNLEKYNCRDLGNLDRNEQFVEQLSAVILSAVDEEL